MKPTSIIHIRPYASPFGKLLLGDCEGMLCLCDWMDSQHRSTIDRRLQTALRARYYPGTTELIAEAIRQLKAYFRGDRRAFDLPLVAIGTDFQRSVWKVLRTIPYGKTLSYAEEARRLGRPEAIRAVAAANGANPLAILIPCHRVIGGHGKLVGYAGGIAAKRDLLALENPSFRG